MRLIIASLVFCGLGAAATSTSEASAFPGAEGRVLFAVSVDRGEGVSDPDLFAVDPDGSDLKNLTDQAFMQSTATWSPDGRRIAYATEAGLSLMRPDGSGARQLVLFRPGEPYYKYPIWPAWSPDGSKLVYVENLWDPFAREYGGSSLVTVSAQGERLRRLESFDVRVFSPSWSPDGRRISFIKCEQTDLVVRVHYQGCSVHVLHVKTGDSIKLGSQIEPWDAWPEWTLDGRIVFLSQQDCLPAQGADCSGIYRMKPDGSELELLAPPRDWNGDGNPDRYLRAVPSPEAPSRLLVSVQVGEAYDNEIWLWDMKTDRRSRVYAGAHVNDTLAWQSRCTLRGSNADDALTGTPDRDLICGLGGDDVIKGVGGDDVIFGDAGDDSVIGGAGRDIVVGNAGRDRCDRDERDHSRVC